MDYPGLADLLLTLHDRDEVLLPSAAATAADQPGFHDLVTERLRVQGDDILAQAMLASMLIRHGWDIRGGLRAEQVSADQFDRFHAHLREAESMLIELCAVEPGWTFPWFLRLVTARGLELGESESRRRYDRLAELNPHHFPAQSQLLQTLCPKWGGSWDRLFAFARETANASPAGSRAHGLVADAHYERWLELGDDERIAYLRRPEVLAELRAAADRSVFHPDFDPGFGWVQLHSLFGTLLALAGDENGAARHFATLGPVIDVDVWGYLGESSARTTVERARDAALARGGVA